MSVHVASWAWKQKLGDPGLKLVLVKLADNADDRGYSWWGQDRLAEECEMSRATVHRKLKLLTERGYIEVERRESTNGAQLANGYRLLRPPSQSDTPPSHNSDMGRVSTVMQQEPSVEPSTKRSSSSSNGDGAKTPKTVGGEKVSDYEHSMVDAILAHFNGVSGKSFGAVDYRKKILRRMREHPELDADRHCALIDEQFEHPWWSGDPTPSVMYGNGAVFDVALNGVRKKSRLSESYDRDDD